MKAVATARGKAGGTVDRLASRLQRPPNDIDIAVDHVLRTVDVGTLNDLPAFVAHVRECFEPTRFRVIDHGGPGGADPDPVVQRFNLFVRQVGEGLPPLPVRHAVATAKAMDRLRGDRTPFDRAYWSLDVAAHAVRASSRARPGRVLYQAVRHLRVSSALEFGTGYGISALFMLAAMADGGPDVQLDTIESSEPQFSVSSALLRDAYGSAARVHHGRSREVLPQLAHLTGIGLFFHDGGHDREQYVADFAAVEPLLGAGALVIYDDIKWEDARRPEVEKQTYEGWTEVRQHPRVARAVEVAGKYGVLLLRE